MYKCSSLSLSLTHTHTHTHVGYTLLVYCPPWKRPHLPCVIVASGNDHIFGWVEGQAVDGIVVSADCSGRLKSTCTSEVGGDWVVLGGVVWVTGLSRKLIR